MVIAKLRYFFEGAGIALLVLLTHVWPLLSPYHVAIYHDPSSASSFASGLAIDLIILSVVFAGVFVVLRRLSPKKSAYLWAILLSFCITRVTAATIFLVKYYLHATFPWTQKMELALFCVFILAGLVIAHFLPSLFRTSVKTARFGLAIFGGCILWMLPDLALIAVVAHTSVPSTHAFNRPVSQTSPAHERVIWVLMDELSYDQVYEHRQPNVSLPHFDELKSESVVFSNVRPEGYFTERILPALLLGRRIDNIRSSLKSDLYIHFTGMPRWETFNQQGSIFGEAKRLGWTTGLVGWYNPYCHLLHDVLDSCYWKEGDPTHDLSGKRHPVLSGAAFPFSSLLSRFENSTRDPAIEQHTKNYKDLTTAADGLIENESIGFVFLHLPVPHPPGIYDRKTGTLGVRGSYIDNLALADKTVGALVQAIEKTSMANQTTLIVSSDHSWRVKLWQIDSSWTAEDENVSRDRFDPRPFLLIRFPKETSAEIRAEPFPELGIHGILGAMLKSEIRSRSDLDQWLATHEAEGEDIAGTRQ